jgi:hypothetical protein
MQRDDEGISFRLAGFKKCSAQALHGVEVDNIGPQRA